MTFTGLRWAVLSLFALCFASGIQAQDTERAVVRATQVLETEEVIETLRAQLATLSKSAMNLRIPDARAAKLFQARVRILGLGPAGSTEVTDVLDLGVKRWHWPIAAEPGLVAAKDVEFWSGFMDTVEFFHHGKFFTKRGSFANEEHSRFRTDSGFKALAQLKTGEMAYVESELAIVWEGAAKTAGKGWTIAELRTKNFRLTATDRPLFTDVLGLALSAKDRARARQSLRDEKLIEWIIALGNGELEVEDSVTAQLEALNDHTWHMHMSHVSVVDIDADGYDDFYVCPSDSTPLFFHNRGDGTFEETSRKMGLSHEGVEAATFADFDNDGDPDAFLSFFPGTTHYFRNESGRFVDRSNLSSRPFPELAVAISPMDYDGDGLLDVYFSRYNGFWLGVTASRMEAARDDGEEVEPIFPGMEADESKILFEHLFSESVDPFVNRPGPPNRLFRNLGNGRFAPAEGAEAAEQFTQSMASTWSDFDLDGDMDLYVVTEAAPNQLVRNNGDGTFTDITDAATSDIGFGMGLGLGDYDNDGRQDVYVTNMYSKAGLRISEQIGASESIRGSARGNSLLRNGAEGWVRVSGMHEPDILVEAADFGWGAAFADFNNDGYLDLYAPAGFVTMPKIVESVGET